VARHVRVDPNASLTGLVSPNEQRGCETGELVSTLAQIALEANQSTNVSVPAPKAVRLASTTGAPNTSPVVPVVDAVTPVVGGVARGEHHIGNR